MSEPQKNAGLSPLKQAYLALEEMQARLRLFHLAQREPIAIIGMACRFPGGANDADSYWQLLRDGVEATRILYVPFYEISSLLGLHDPILAITRWFEAHHLPQTFNKSAQAGRIVRRGFGRTFHAGMP